ncbi:MAG: molybdopterin cofactor-binding domain-containing protein [Bryobacteraceae bacterium]|jgi:CO/xanthine dehydrogenase Mo-binding subunit
MKTVEPKSIEAVSGAHDPSRREFLATAGAGLFVFFRIPAAAQEPARLQDRVGAPADFNAYLKIGADGRVTGFSGKVELGQGATTAFAELLAEELDVAYDSVDMVLGDTDLCPYDMGTFGSMGVSTFGPAMRRAAAEARAALFEMAAEKLQSPLDRLRVTGGVITDSTAPAKRVTYAQLVEGKRIERHVVSFPQKAPGAFAVIGKPQRRKDASDKVTGKAKYAGDIVPPGLLHARILRPPAHGATLKSVDTSAAAQAPGVTVVNQNGLVAVLHAHRDLADRALGLVKAQFDKPKAGADDQTIFDHLLKTAPPPQVVGQTGNLAEGEKAAATVLEQTYLNSYVAHAPMETHSATVRIENGKVTVWASTQGPFGVKSAVAQALGVDPQNVRVIAGYVGGGFGGKTAAPQAVDAARLAKITGKPVQVVWDRAEEFFFDPFRPAAVVKVRAGLTADGRVAFWDYAVVGAGARGAETMYDIPNFRSTSAGEWMGGNPPDMHPFAVGPWRAPSVNTNAFARESHMDALASKAGEDPLAFRLKHLDAGEGRRHPRMRRVLQAAAAKFGWKEGKAPSGRGMGVSCGVYSTAHVAACAEVAVNKSTGRVQVKRVTLAQDNGLTVNPDGIRQQMEGSITMGLGYVLSEEVRFKDGVVLSQNFDTYGIPRFSWVPEIETVLIDNQATPAEGSGEPPIINMGSVVANAIFDAVGVRMTQLPMTPARILAALQKA